MVMATKRPTGAYPKASKKSIATARFKDAQKNGRVLSGEVITPGSAIRLGAKVLSAVQKAAIKRAVRENVAEKTAQRVGSKAKPMYSKVSNRDATILAEKQVGRHGPRPIKRENYGNRMVKSSSRGLSKSEGVQSRKVDTITRPKPNKPKDIVRIKTEKKMERNNRIRQQLTIRVNPARVKKSTPAAPKRPSKPLRSIDEVLKPLAGKKVKTGTLPNGRPIRMDAQKYVQERANQRIAGRNPKNSLVKSRSERNIIDEDKMSPQQLRIAKDARLERRGLRKDLQRDIRATEANPKRYSNARRASGENTAVEGSIAKADKKIAELSKRKAIQNEKIARTPRAQKKVEGSLQAERAAGMKRAQQRAIKTNKAGGVKPFKPQRTRRGN
jgi:hypothetical protein